MGIFSWIHRKKTTRESDLLRGQFYNALPQAATDHNVNAMVRIYLEGIKVALEKATGEIFVIGCKQPSEMIPKEKSGAVHYQPEYGFLLQYLARQDADHRNGPVIEQDDVRKPSWILCASPHGLFLAVELFEISMEPLVVESMRDETMYSSILTIHQIFWDRNSPIRGSVHWMKHIIHPTPVPTYRHTGTDRA
ncbi:MAG: hypothetical protein AAB879_02605 [Patescibacteria group bacterium]